MYITLLEYFLVRLTIGAVGLLARTASLVLAIAVQVIGKLAGIALRPLVRELAHALGRMRGTALWQRRRHA